MYIYINACKKDHASLLHRCERVCIPHLCFLLTKALRYTRLLIECKRISLHHDGSYNAVGHTMKAHSFVPVGQWTWIVMMSALRSFSAFMGLVVSSQATFAPTWAPSYF